MPSSKRVSFSTILHDCSHNGKTDPEGLNFSGIPKADVLVFLTVSLTDGTFLAINESNFFQKVVSR